MRKLATQGKFSLLSPERAGKRLPFPACLLDLAVMPVRPGSPTLNVVTGQESA